jgi:hypothetical protein
MQRKPLSYHPSKILDTHSLASIQDYEHYGGYIQLAWMISTAFGIILFLIDLAIVAYLKVFEFKI